MRRRDFAALLVGGTAMRYAFTRNSHDSYLELAYSCRERRHRSRFAQRHSSMD